MNHIRCNFCEHIPQLQLKNDNDIVKIKCEYCGNRRIVDVQLFLKETKKNYIIHRKKTFQKKIEDVGWLSEDFSKCTNQNEINVNMIKERVERLQYIVNKKMLSIKNRFINDCFNQINEIESSYEKYQQRANTYIEMINILIEDYMNGKLDSETYLNLSTNSDINVYDIKQDPSYDELKSYFNTYIFYTQSNIDTMSSIKTEKTHSHIYSMVILKDGRLAIGCDDKKIKIYNIKNNYTHDFSFQAHKKTVQSLCLLQNGTLVSSSFDCDIKFWVIHNNSFFLSFTIESAHNEIVTKVLELPNNQIASCSYDSTIKIWNVSPINSNPKKIIN